VERKKIAVFDFDGTITQKDTLWEFLNFSQSKAQLFFGILFLSPVLFLYKIHVFSNHKAKEILFAHFFKNWDLLHFNEICNDFASIIHQITRPKIIDLINYHKHNNHQLFIVSASIENWIIPWAKEHEIKVIATKIEADSLGKLTGRFETKNCFGKEKVNRLLEELLSCRDSYYIFAYGDSDGDKELIDFANKGIYVR